MKYKGESPITYGKSYINDEGVEIPLENKLTEEG